MFLTHNIYFLFVLCQAEWGARIVLGKPHTVPCETVDVRRFYVGIAVDAEIAISQIVGKDEEDVHVLMGSKLATAGNISPSSWTPSSRLSGSVTMCFLPEYVVVSSM